MDRAESPGRGPKSSFESVDRRHFCQCRYLPDMGSHCREGRSSLVAGVSRSMKAGDCQLVFLASFMGVTGASRHKPLLRASL